MATRHWADKDGVRKSLGAEASEMTVKFWEETRVGRLARAIECR